MKMMRPNRPFWFLTNIIKPHIDKRKKHSVNDILILVKVISALFQAKQLCDKDLAEEIYSTYKDLPQADAELYQAEKELRSSVRALVNWLYKQPEDGTVIKSLLEQRLLSLPKDTGDIVDAIKTGMTDYGEEEVVRRVVYKHMTEIKLSLEGEEFSKKFKRAVKAFYFKDLEDVEKEDWIDLLDLVQEKINATYEEHQSEIISTVNTNEPMSFVDVIEQAKKESDKSSIIRTGIQGVNDALNPDGGFRRGKVYLFEALTNRGKSLWLSHVTASIGLYNKPVLRDAKRIPTILMESAEDTMDLIVMRMYKLALSVRKETDKCFKTDEVENIIDTIVSCFKENGWFLIINHIDPSKDSPTSMFARIRKLMLGGHEIIAWIYDYLGLQTESLRGDTRSDQMQIQVRNVRTFCNARGICFFTAAQLNPMAKQMLVESDDESEVYFAKIVAGKSLTEGSTKITNEYDAVMTIHVAKTDTKSYFTYCLGKMRGNETCKPEERFGIYDLCPVNGLVHDINGKPGFRRTLTSVRTEDGKLEDTWDAL